MAVRRREFISLRGDSAIVLPLAARVGIPPTGPATKNSSIDELQPNDAGAMIRRWRRIIVIVAFALPAIMVICAALIVAYPGSWFARLWLAEASSVRVSYKEIFSGGQLLGLLVTVLLFGISLDWPFFVLAARIKRNVLKHWPNARAAQAAIVGGLAGLLIPYTCGYIAAVGMAVRFDVGSLLFPLVVWPIAGLLAFIGLRIGPAVVAMLPPRVRE
jgi:hypothetical protein